MFSFPPALVIPKQSNPKSKVQPPHTKAQIVSRSLSSVPFPDFIVVLLILKHSWWLSLIYIYAPALPQSSLSSIRHFRLHAFRVQLSDQDWSTKPLSSALFYVQYFMLPSAIFQSYCLSAPHPQLCASSNSTALQRETSPLTSIFILL